MYFLSVFIQIFSSAFVHQKPCQTSIVANAIDLRSKGSLYLSHVSPPIHVFSGDMYDAEGGGEEPEWVQKEREQFKSHRDKDGNGHLDKEEVRYLSSIISVWCITT